MPARLKQQNLSIWRPVLRFAIAELTLTALTSVAKV
jgi:hypothetical protein